MRNTLPLLQSKTLDNIKGLVASFEKLSTERTKDQSFLSKYTDICGYDLLCSKNDGEPILIIPSLINRYNILDITQKHSFVRNVSAQGFKVYLLDWHSGGSSPESFEECLKIIEQCVEKIDSKVHILGHCMGGILCLPILEKLADRISSFISIATPFSFTHPKFQFFSTYINKFGVVPNNGSWLRDFFYLAKPFSINSNFRDLFHGDDAEIAINTTKWVNNTPNLNCNILKQCANDLISGGSFLADVKSGVKSIVIAGKYDSISPIECTLSSSNILENSILKVFETGHIGLVTNKSAELTKFIAENTIKV